MIAHPRTTLELIGHDHAQSQVLQVLSSGRMPHAWVLTGMEGVGKATLAYRLARFLLAGQNLAGKGAGQGLAVSGHHPAASLIAAGSHPDLLVLEREWDEKKGRLYKNISIEAVRQVAPFLGLTASQGQWRITLVDGAESLSDEAQNALLKTLEEPPAHSVLLLVTRSVAALLPTIRSRARVLALPGLEARHLRQLAATHGIMAEDGVLFELAEGSAAKLFRYASADAAAMLRQWLGFLIQPHHLPTRLRLAESWGGGKEHPLYDTACELVLFWLQRLIKAKALHGVGATPLTPLLAEETPLIAEAYPPLTLAPLLRLWDATNAQFHATQHGNLDPKATLLALMEKVAVVMGGGG